uniref:Uncharacterized protein n=1 Tax=Knipowitschia caucasica TaxID=637954 RepID=A0AAV2LAP0_KNICA
MQEKLRFEQDGIGLQDVAISAETLTTQRWSLHSLMALVSYRHYPAVPPFILKGILASTRARTSVPTRSVRHRDMTEVCVDVKQATRLRIRFRKDRALKQTQHWELTGKTEAPKE